MKKYPYTEENPREIIILAMGPGRSQCPFDAEVWAVNMAYQQVAQIHGRIDKIFMCHSQVISPAGNPYFNWEDYRMMHAAGIELFNIHRVKGVPFKMFPLKRIIQKFNCGYFSDTMCYMIAYALHICTKIDRKTGRPILRYPLNLRLYGVDMQEKDEYYDEKGGIEYWLGLAWGLGAEFTTSYGSTLLLTRGGVPYGMEPLKLGAYDPLGLMTNKPISSSELTPEKIKQIAEKMDKARRVDPKSKWFNGERSVGLHRDLDTEANRQSYLMGAGSDE